MRPAGGKTVSQTKSSTTVPHVAEQARADRLMSRDGRAVIVALDHPLTMGQSAGLDQPQKVLVDLADNHPEAAILTPGGARLRNEIAPDLPWLLTADYFGSSVDPGHPGDEELHAMLWSAAHARSLGADGVKCLWVHGQKDAEQHVQALGRVANLIEDSRTADLTVMVEAVLWGQHLAPQLERDGARVASAARMAFELGADIIKVAMPDDVRPLAKVVEACPVPIVAMGGPAEEPAALFEKVRSVLDVGMRGVALGRNVWQAGQTGAMVKALRALVHDDASAVDATAVFLDGVHA